MGISIYLLNEKKKKKAKLKEDFFLVDKNQNGNTKLKVEEEQMIEYRGVF